jgi:hypothetical protein
MEEQVSSEPQRFTDSEAAELVGKSILIGITYLDHAGKELQRSQMHGIVSSASSKSIEVSLRGARHGESFSLPPDPHFFAAAAPGKYKLHSTGEVVENPQVLCTATLTKPQKH